MNVSLYSQAYQTRNNVPFKAEKTSQQQKNINGVLEGISSIVNKMDYYQGGYFEELHQSDMPKIVSNLSELGDLPHNPCKDLAGALAEAYMGNGTNVR